MDVTTFRLIFTKNSLVICNSLQFVTLMRIANVMSYPTMLIYIYRL